MWSSVFRMDFRGTSFIWAYGFRGFIHSVMVPCLWTEMAGRACAFQLFASPLTRKEREQSGGWRHGLAAKSTCCTYRGDRYPSPARTRPLLTIYSSDLPTGLHSGWLGTGSGDVSFLFLTDTSIVVTSYLSQWFETFINTKIFGFQGKLNVQNKFILVM